MSTAPTDILDQCLRPAGGGIHVVSTGVEAQRALQQALYGVEDPAAVLAAWRADRARLTQARVVLLGVPSDAGAGFTRGANRAPEALRARALVHKDTELLRDPRVLDLGDVRVVPHLLSEEMLAPGQRQACQAALYGPGADPGLPVSPLGITARVLAEVAARAPGAVPVLLGGDHSVSWPLFEALYAQHERGAGRRLGVLHFDAHTDLLPERLGVRYCFATWAWHANALLGGDGRLVQVGIRASGRDRAHWEGSLGVRQHWAEAVAGRAVADLAGEIAAHFEARGVDALYVTNDIDGTDPAFAAATGTPEPGGLHPDLVVGLIEALGARFPVVGGDVVEVAPPLAGAVAGEPERTLDTALRYLRATVSVALQGAGLSGSSG